MSLTTAMFSAVSGLDNNSTDLSVIGDNIANANTIGFKGSRAAFEDALAQTLIGGAGQRGLGSRLQAVQRMITQGALTNTGMATDLALQGKGFFVVKGEHNGVDGQFYTRAGQFTVDDSGYLVDLQGLRVQGYLADDLGTISQGMGDLMVGSAPASPRPTGDVTLKGNLQADAVVPAAFDATQASATSNFSTSTTVYDSLGTAHQVDIYYRRSGAGTWEWHALSDGGGLTGGTAGTPTEIASGTLTYDTSGNLADMTQTSNFTPLGSVNPQALNFNFGDPTAASGTGAKGLTQFASPSTVTFMNQDGYASGELARISIEADGTIMGAFTNGQSRALGQVALADFEAPDRLERLGGNLYGEMPASGQPTLGAPGNGGRGSVVAGALEQSNIDLATEFVRMISAQRGFQANSKTITTADQLLNELIALKR